MQTRASRATRLATTPPALCRQSAIVKVRISPASRSFARKILIDPGLSYEYWWTQGKETTYNLLTPSGVRSLPFPLAFEYVGF